MAHKLSEFAAGEVARILAQETALGYEVDDEDVPTLDAEQINAADAAEVQRIIDRTAKK